MNSQTCEELGDRIVRQCSDGPEKVPDVFTIPPLVGSLCGLLRRQSVRIRWHPTKSRGAFAVVRSFKGERFQHHFCASALKPVIFQYTCSAG
mmetsp:Transcript_9979/g.27930  ORF Transcript_9979/g.27930 Transcript_9979/m.27930 type:complete len:92 (+) Transcript_9979:1504-1779(+)